MSDTITSNRMANGLNSRQRATLMTGQNGYTVIGKKVTLQALHRRGLIGDDFRWTERGTEVAAVIASWERPADVPQETDAHGLDAGDIVEITADGDDQGLRMEYRRTLPGGRLLAAVPKGTPVGSSRGMRLFPVDAVQLITDDADQAARADTVRKQLDRVLPVDAPAVPAELAPGGETPLPADVRDVLATVPVGNFSDVTLYQGAVRDLSKIATVSPHVCQALLDAPRPTAGPVVAAIVGRGTVLLIGPFESTDAVAAWWQIEHNRVAESAQLAVVALPDGPGATMMYATITVDGQQLVVRGVDALGRMLYVAPEGTPYHDSSAHRWIPVPVPAAAAQETAAAVDIEDTTPATREQTPVRDSYNGHGQPATIIYYGRKSTPAATGRTVRIERSGFNGMAFVDAATGEVIESVGGTAKFWATPVTEPVTDDTAPRAARDVKVTAPLPHHSTGPRPAAVWPCPSALDEPAQVTDTAAADGPVLDANGDPVVNFPPDLIITSAWRAWFAARVPVGCGHYIALSEARAGLDHCERCGPEDVAPAAPGAWDDWFAPGARVAALRYEGKALGYSARVIRVTRTSPSMVFTDDGNRWWRNKAFFLVGSQTLRRPGSWRLVPIDNPRVIQTIGAEMTVEQATAVAAERGIVVGSRVQIWASGTADHDWFVTGFASHWNELSERWVAFAQLRGDDADGTAISTWVVDQLVTVAAPVERPLLEEVTYDGRGDNEYGVPLRALADTLVYDGHEREWRFNGRYTGQISEDDLEGAIAWAESLLADQDDDQVARFVDSCTPRRDRYGSWFTPELTEECSSCESTGSNCPVHDNALRYRARHTQTMLQLRPLPVPAG